MAQNAAKWRNFQQRAASIGAPSRRLAAGGFLAAARLSVDRHSSTPPTQSPAAPCRRARPTPSTATAATIILSGLAGDDTLDGGTGSDSLHGGLGNDTYIVDNAGDAIYERPGEGTDTVLSSVTHALAANVENLTLTGSDWNSATGNALDNVITGNAGNNTLAGLAGADRLIGGAGTDTATYAASDAGVRVSLVDGLGHGGHAEGDILSAIENLTGSNYSDTLEGNAGTNILAGGAGTDTVSYEHASRAVAVDLANAAAQATGGAGSDRLSGFENLTGSAFSHTLTGTTGAKALCGLAGDDTLNAGAGDDRLAGGAGNDTLTGGTGSDTFVFNFPSDGIDTVTDFVSGTDFLQISASGFGGGLVAGGAAALVMSADLAGASASAPDHGGYFILDNSGVAAGTLYWDATGGASDDAMAVARLAGVTTLHSADLLVG